MSSDWYYQKREDFGIYEWDWPEEYEREEDEYEEDKGEYGDDEP